MAPVPREETLALCNARFCIFFFLELGSGHPKNEKFMKSIIYMLEDK